MNMYIFIAGCLTILLGIVHSFLGEFLIFKHHRNKGRLIPSIESANLKERHIRIIWSTWHFATVFGWCIGILLIKMAFQQELLNTNFAKFIINIITYCMLIASFVVLIGTKGKHPGWIVLLMISILLGFS